MDEPEGTLKNPTVGEVIELLKRMPQDAPFLIRDTDTSWTIFEIYWRLGGDLRFWMWGDYLTMMAD